MKGVRDSGWYCSTHQPVCVLTTEGHDVVISSKSQWFYTLLCDGQLGAAPRGDTVRLRKTKLIISSGARDRRDSTQGHMGKISVGQKAEDRSRGSL